LQLAQQILRTFTKMYFQVSPPKKGKL